MKLCRIEIINDYVNELEIDCVELSSEEKAKLLYELTNNFSYSKDLVYVLTPGGDVETLQVGSTPIDFAYRIHTDIGNHCSEARVNGQKVPLNTQLRNGDTVEIVTRKNSQPKREWLIQPKNPEKEHPFIKSPKTRNKVKQWFKKKSYEESIARGHELLAREFGRTSYDTTQKSHLMLKVAQDLNYPNIDGLLAALGYGAISLQQVINRLRDVKYKCGRELLIKELGNLNLENLEKSNFFIQIANQLSYDNFKDFVIDLGGNQIVLNTSLLIKLKDKARAIDEENLETGKSSNKNSTSTSSYPLNELINEKYIRWIIGGEDKLRYRFASCCKVYPCGENIGVVKLSGLGIVIHNKNCKNLGKVTKERLVDITNAIEIEIRTDDRIGMERDIAECLAQYNLNIRAGSVKTFPKKEEIPKKEAIFFKSIIIANSADVKNLQSALSVICEIEDVQKATFIEKKLTIIKERNTNYFEEK